MVLGTLPWTVTCGDCLVSSFAVLSVEFSSAPDLTSCPPTRSGSGLLFMAPTADSSMVGVVVCVCSSTVAFPSFCSSWGWSPEVSSAVGEGREFVVGTTTGASVVAGIIACGWVNATKMLLRHTYGSQCICAVMVG